MVKTAVLMATYNGQGFIHDQLDSIRNQTLRPDYVLMRDDGSTDDTVKVVEDYIKEHRLDGWSITSNDKNLGWRLNFRQLLLDAKRLSVDYLFFSDQDDTWYHHKNKMQVDIMEERQDINLLSADIDIKKLSEEATIPNNFKFNGEETISKYPLDFSYHNYRQGWTFCLRKSFVDQVMTFYSDNLILSHDNLFAGISGVIGSGYNLNRSVGEHKRHAENASGNILNMSSSYERHLQELYFVLNYYIILVPFLEKSSSSQLREAKAYLDFNQQRYKNAQNKDFVAILKQMMTKKRFYDSFSNRIRDLVFLLKDIKRS
ncbi:TPA: glycosyltransferase [Streptococcus agalactiae]|nr:glycosyltransferase [Streptococcus agalactiae]HEO4262971.1 glycosyltransferase [Streptococcus agalactiae]HEO4268481.1 glycosyltransferase [Streptococcus agalactiae]HEO5177134.1 glycosyltransferase [Streptococcus agalactiae]HEO5742748.1 glycosyltransferase [Streptococcus agalactiae]